MKNTSFLLFRFYFEFVFCRSKTRQVVDFTQNWKFKINDTIVAGSSKNLDDSKWRTLNLPHDWSVESDFGKDFLLLQAAELCPAGLAGIVNFHHRQGR